MKNTERGSGCPRTSLKHYITGNRFRSDGEREKISNECLTRNMLRTRSMLVVLLAVELYIIITSLTDRPHGELTGWFLAGAIMTASVCVIFSVYYIIESRHHARYIVNKIATDICWACIMVGALLFSYGEAAEGKHLFSATLFILAIGVIPVLNVWEVVPTLAVFAGADIVFMLLCDSPVIFIQELILLVIFSVFVSAAQYIALNDLMAERLMLSVRNQTLTEMSERDPLTGVLNRRGMANLMQKTIQLGGQYAVFMLDIDNFKDYNDKYFHEGGDVCLQKIASALTRCVFRKDDLVGRYGGEEFLIYAYGIEKRDVISVAERIQNEIAALKIEFDQNKTGRYVTVSIGAAFSPEDGQLPLNDVIGAADMELYNAKGNGKNCISFCGEIYKAVSVKQRISANPFEHQTEEAAVHHGKRTVLVVDDQPLNREMLSLILSAEYNVVTAVNGMEALDILTRGEIQVAAVMLDIVMPEMDGFDFLTRFREFDSLSNIPVIVTTGNNEKDSEKKALMYGAWDFVSKPYDATIIKFRLKNAIDRSQLSAFNRLKYLSEFDALTGIYNKTRFYEVTHDLLMTGSYESYALIRFDINYNGLKNLDKKVAQNK